MKTNEIELQVDLEDTDMDGLVFYPRYFYWFDRATRAFLKSIGLNHNQLWSQYHYTQPVTECGCQFIHPLRYDHSIRITTSVTEVHEQYFRLQHIIHNGDLLVGSGYEVRAWVRIDKPDHNNHFAVVPIPEEIVSKLTGLSKEFAPGKYSEYENIPI